MPSSLTETSKELYLSTRELLIEDPRLTETQVIADITTKFPKLHFLNTVVDCRESSPSLVPVGARSELWLELGSSSLSGELEVLEFFYNLGCPDLRVPEPRTERDRRWLKFGSALRRLREEVWSSEKKFDEIGLRQYGIVGIADMLRVSNT